MKGIVTIDPDTLKKFYHIGENYDHNISYIYNSKLVRHLVWSRYKKMIDIIPADKSHNRVMDLGCGEGTFLPTLDQYFNEAYGLDINTKVAEEIVRYFDLKNIQLMEKDILANGLHYNSFDIIFAASCLEHFKDQKKLLQELNRLLKKGGLLVFSSPTESLFYELGRKVFGYVKPSDHYFSVFEIADYASQLFELVSYENGPFKMLPGMFSVYVVYVFKKQ
ncbi:MAG: class I SAM-dependent methyltransferase [Candidatus Scalindua sp.]|nr:class I SAM-dependent methyltransferase [Candidatus Scalindua sp.]